MKSALSRGVRFFREGVKKTATFLAGKTCRTASFPIFGVPCGLTYGLGIREGTKQVVYPPQGLFLQPPRTIEDNLHWVIKSLLKGTYLQEEGILILDHGMATSKGGNLSYQGKLVKTYLQPIDGKLPHQNDLFRFSTKRFFPKIFHAKQPIVTLAAGWQGAFYHWVFEVLPRLHLAEKAGYHSLPLYVECATRFQKESLELFEISPSQIINAHAYEAVKAPKIIAPSIPLTPAVWSCNFLREKILPKLVKKQPLRLYVSRSDARRRRIINEEATYHLLRTYGFEKVKLSTLSFKEQAEYFYAAEAIVAPHGAGLSHLVFCEPNTLVLEIFSPDYYHSCYWHVSDRVGLKYHCLFGEGERPPDFVMTSLDPDIVVDLGKLEKSLKLMGL